MGVLNKFDSIFSTFSRLKSITIKCRNYIQSQHDPGSGSVTRGDWENWRKSMCASFGEECTPQKPPSDSESLQKFIVRKLIKIDLEVTSEIKKLKNFGV